MRVVIALGGNALLRRGESLNAGVQRRNVAAAASAIAGVAREHEVILTHGNGPQVGLLAMESFAFSPSSPYPLDVLGAESQGMIGYLLETALRNVLPGREMVTVLGQVLVEAGDPAFARPTKPIGPILVREQANRLAAERGWQFASELTGMRRVVPSPEPTRILEIGSIVKLVEAGVLVISAGGGGVPVVRAPGGVLEGVEAVVDKDLTAALLAHQLHAERLLLLTDVRAVEERWGDQSSRTFRAASPAQLRRFSFAPGSMGPKVEAACRFAEQSGGTAAIGALDDARAILDGLAGTAVRSDARQVDWW